MSAVAAPVRRRRRRSRRRIAGRVGLNALALLVFVLMVFPVYWMVNTAFKPGVDIQSYTPKFFPNPATLRNFTDTIRTGRHLGRGRPILPPMPIPMYKHFTDEDLAAIYTYLQTIPPVENRVPEPVPPKQ